MSAAEFPVSTVSTVPVELPEDSATPPYPPKPTRRYTRKENRNA